MKLGMTLCIGIHASAPNCSPTGTLPESNGGKPHSSGTKLLSERRTWSGLSAACKEPTLSRFWSGTHTTTCPKRRSDGGTQEEEQTLTVHPCTLTSLHARNRILKHEAACALLALRLRDRVGVLIKANISSELASSSKEHIRARLPASGHDHIVVVPTHDVLAEARKDVLQVRGLALVIGPRGAGRDGYGDGVVGEVRDEARDAGQELDVRPTGVLCGGALRDVVVDREGDVWEEGEQVDGCGPLGCGGVRAGKGYVDRLLLCQNEGGRGFERATTHVCP